MLARAEDTADRAAAPVRGQVNLGAQPAARAAQRLPARPSRRIVSDANGAPHLQPVCEAEPSLWSDVVREAGDAVRDGAAIGGPGDAVVERGEDVRVARHESPEADREYNADNQCQDAAHDPCDGLPGVCRALGPPAGGGNAAEDRDQASQQAKREQDEGHGGHQAGHAENQGGHAQAVSRPG
jgi:hypothetical protein